MDKEITNEKRYYCSSRAEEAILYDGLNKYFLEPERSPIRHSILLFYHSKLQAFSPHWTVRAIRLWFNNHKNDIKMHIQNRNMIPINYTIFCQNPVQNNKNQTNFKITDSIYFEKVSEKNHDSIVARVEKKNERIRLNNLKFISNLSVNNKSVPKQESTQIKSNYCELISEIEKKYPIVADLIRHILRIDKDFNESTYKFASYTNFISPKLHKLMIKEIGLPSEYKCKEFEKLSEMVISKYYTNIDKIGEIIHQYKKDHHILQHDELHCCLSVDALFFNPEVKISPKNEIDGMLLSEHDICKLPLNAADLFNSNPDLFESFLRFYHKKIIRSGFVFQIQPYSTIYPTFVVHIIPSPTGKGNENIVESLKNIKVISKKYKILIQTFAFDGDKCFNILHQLYFNSYFNFILKNSTFKLIHKSKTMRVVTDGLHLLKRLRYRLFKCRVHAGFNIQNPFIEIESLMRTLKHLPSVVFNNEKITKMNDHLPLMMFSLESFVILLENQNYVAASYWLPITAFIISLTNNNLSYEWQKYFLEVSFWFLFHYKKIELIEIDSQKGKILKQRKSADDLDVRFFTNEQLIQFLNTIHCHIQFMEKYGCYYCFDRNSSMPLEHKFGVTRIGCKDINTLSQFIKTLADIEKYATSFRNLNENTKVNGRRNTFGITVSNFFEKEMNEFSIDDFSPEDVALAILHLSSFNCNCKNDANQVISWFYHVVKNLDSGIEQKLKRKKSATSNSLLLGTKSNIRSRFLIQNQSYVFPKSLDIQEKIPKKEDSFTKFLNLFIEIKKKEPELDDYKNLYELIKEHDFQCPQIIETNLFESYESWIQDHFFEYEALIFQILTDI